MSALVIAGSDKSGTTYGILIFQSRLDFQQIFQIQLDFILECSKQSLDHPNSLIRYSLSFRLINGSTVLISIRPDSDPGDFSRCLDDTMENAGWNCKMEHEMEEGEHHECVKSLSFGTGSCISEGGGSFVGG